MKLHKNVSCVITGRLKNCPAEDLECSTAPYRRGPHFAGQTGPPALAASRFPLHFCHRLTSRFLFSSVTQLIDPPSTSEPIKLQVPAGTALPWHFPPPRTLFPPLCMQISPQTADCLLSSPLLVSFYFFLPLKKGQKIPRRCSLPGMRPTFQTPVTADGSVSHKAEAAFSEHSTCPSSFLPSFFVFFRGNGLREPPFLDYCNVKLVERGW